MDMMRKRADKGKDPKDQLGPCKPEEFPQDVRSFIHGPLENALTDSSEKERLAKAKDHWPEYPLTLLELARKHNLSIPELMLPGPPQEWERFRPLRPNPADK